MRDGVALDGKSSPREKLIALVLTPAVLAMTLSGCATPAVLHKWNRSGHVQVETYPGKLETPRPAFRWAKWIPADQENSDVNDPRAGAVVTSGAVTLSPQLEGCEQIELYLMGGIEPPVLIPEEGISYLHTSGVPEAVRKQMWEKMPEADCAVLLTSAVDEEDHHALLYASTGSGRFQTIDLGPTKHPGWAWLLPFAVLYDASVIAVASAVILFWLIEVEGEEDERTGST